MEEHHKKKKKSKSKSLGEAHQENDYKMAPSNENQKYDSAEWPLLLKVNL